MLLLAIVCCFVIGGRPTAASAEDVVIVQTLGTMIHQQIAAGISSVVRGKVTVMSLDDIGMKPRPKPSVYVAIGANALEGVKHSGVPVVFAMVLNTREVGVVGREITGVEAFVSMDRQVQELRAVLPKASRVGVVHSPGTSYIADRAKEAGRKKGFTVISRVANSEEEAMAAIDNIKGIDVFWLLPDTTVVTQNTVKHLLALSLQLKIPVYGLAEKYVKDGALLALGADPEELGHQIGEIVNLVLRGEKASAIPIQPIKAARLYINAATARRLHIDIPDNVLAGAQVYKELK